MELIEFVRKFKEYHMKSYYNKGCEWGCKLFSKDNKKQIARIVCNKYYNKITISTNNKIYDNLTDFEKDIKANV